MNEVYLQRGRRLDWSFMRIEADDWVVLKPNLVKESKETDPDEWRSVITDPDLIDSVCSYVGSRLGPRGRITICDAPQTDSSFAKIAARLDLHGIARRCSEAHRVPVEVVDLRNQEWRSEGGIIVSRRELDGDPAGVVRLDLARDSLFYDYHGEGRYYGADYNTVEINRHHRGETHEYLICGTPIRCDVFINMPKMKTHKKAGVTLNLKNLVGINADKNWLPHHTEGSPATGGDEYPELTALRRAEKRAVKFARWLAVRVPGVGPSVAKRLRRAGTPLFGHGDRVIRSGNWHANDTTWRMVLDLNRCLLYGNADGSLRSTDPKRYYSVVDGIVGMQGMGPMQGEPFESGVVLAGTNPVAVDAVAARVMGFDWRKIPVIREAARASRLPLIEGEVEDILVHGSEAGWSGRFADIERQEFFRYEPHFGWKGHIEFDEITRRSA